MEASMIQPTVNAVEHRMAACSSGKATRSRGKNAGYPPENEHFFNRQQSA